MSNTTSSLPAPAPVVHPDAASFWEATGRHEFLVPRCNTCGKSFWYPRPICPFCHAQDVALVAASGHATLHSFTITAKGIGAYQDAGSYVLAFVELAEGPKMLTNIVDCDPSDLRIGDPLSVLFQDTGTGTALPRFRPTARTSDPGQLEN